MRRFTYLIAPLLLIGGLHSAPDVSAQDCTTAEDVTFCSFSEHGHAGPVLPFACDSYDYYCNESYGSWGLF